MLVKTMQKVKSPFTVYAVFTVQAETGLKGAKTVPILLIPIGLLRQMLPFPEITRALI